MSDDRLSRLVAQFVADVQKPGPTRDEAHRLARRVVSAGELLTEERIPTLKEDELRGFFDQIDATGFVFKFDDMLGASGINGMRAALLSLVLRAAQGPLDNQLRIAFPIEGSGAGPAVISQIASARFPQQHWPYSPNRELDLLQNVVGLAATVALRMSYTQAGPHLQNLRQRLVEAGLKSANYLTVDQFLWWAYGRQQTEPQAWLFPANADHYHSVAQLHSARPGSESTSAIRRAARAPRPPHNGKEPHEGDIAVLWQTGKSEGIVAAGLIISEPVNEVANLRFTHVLEQCISSTELRRNAVLKSLEVLTTSSPPSYPLTSDQWTEIRKLMTLGPDAPPLNSTNAIATSLAQQGLHFTPWQIGTYYTALQTKGFVILSGISGTGKTKLAQHFAEMLPRPATTSLEIADETISITVQPSMLKYKDLVIPVRAAQHFDPPPPGV
ncbi:MAG: hypothetical protein AVDCRST_MAG93-2814, partial [uncultured Chloroflexia bacterium]